MVRLHKPKQKRFKPVRFQTAQQAQWFLLVHDLLTVGFSLRHAIRFTLTVYPRLQPFLEHLRRELKGGKSFSAGIRPYVSTDLYYQLLLAEQHGDLDVTLGEIGTLLTVREKQRRKLRGLLQYPLLLLGMLLIVLVGLVSFVYPELATWQNQNNSGSSTSLMTLGINTGLYLLAIILVGILLQRWRWRHATPLQRLITRCHWPIIGPCYTLYYRYYLTTNLAIMLCHGLSLKEIIGVTSRFRRRSLLYQFSLIVNHQLEQGEQLDQTLQMYPFIPGELVIFINKGATLKDLGDELTALAKIQFRRLTQQIESLLVWIQPVIFGLLALIIVALYLSILLPIYHSMQGVV